MCSSDLDEAVMLGIATAHVQQELWADWLDAFLAPVRLSLPGAVSELKLLLQGAASDPDQLRRERQAQIRRIAELRTLLGGG